MRWILAAFFMCLLCGVNGSVPARALAPRPGQVLIERLIAIAESGKMTDAAYVGAALQLEFTSRSEQMDPPGITCMPEYVQKPTEVVYHTSKAPMRSTPSGRSAITVPGSSHLSPSSTVVSGPAKVSYYVARYHDCSGYVQSSNDVDASLQIGPLSSYDCISDAELTSWFPRIRQIDATDGALFYHYESKQTDRNGTSLSFTSSWGSPCILGVTLTQRSSDLPRYKAAMQRQEACMLPHMDAFCRSHPPFDWGAGDVRDEMARYAVRQCGSLDKFIAETPGSARPHEPLIAIEQGISTPCSRVRAKLEAKAKGQ